MPTVTNAFGTHELKRFDYRVATEAGADALAQLDDEILLSLDRHGFVVIENAVAATDCDRLVAEMAPYIDATPHGLHGLGGTRRVGALVARSPASHRMIAHPAILRLAKSVIAEQRLSGDAVRIGGKSGKGKKGFRYPWQLHLTQIIDVGPGGGTDAHPHRLKLHRANGMWVYDMRERNPAHPQNQWLKTAWTEGLPLIYLRGLAPAVYLPLFPVHVADWDAGAGQVRVVLGLECTSQQDLVEPALMGRELSRYTYGRMQNRVSVARFRVGVLEAYRDTCALSGLAQPQLVDAVPIAQGGSGGRLDVTEGLCMSRLHHAAFDANLFGIDPDGRVHLSEQLDTYAPGDLFGRNLMSVAGRRISVPRAPEFQPNRELLAARFEQFQAS